MRRSPQAKFVTRELFAPGSCGVGECSGTFEVQEQVTELSCCPLLACLFLIPHNATKNSTNTVIHASQCNGFRLCRSDKNTNNDIVEAFGVCIRKRRWMTDGAELMYGRGDSIRRCFPGLLMGRAQRCSAGANTSITADTAHL